MRGTGQRLREARQRQGISLAEVEQATHISRQYLEALEREDWQACPGEFYARAFLRTYASYLGLDPAELLPARGAAEWEKESAATRCPGRGRRRVRINVLRLVIVLLLLLLVPGLLLFWLLSGR
ncbi:MAG: helix-turn-helix domain-containing protein [Limnochordales bacterium]|nr:helix-turn-helix domain-containing protein [Limnochordales bacterium]